MGAHTFPGQGGIGKLRMSGIFAEDVSNSETRQGEAVGVEEHLILAGVFCLAPSRTSRDTIMIS